MFKREMKVNLKGFLIWAIVLISLYLVIYLVYPSVIEGDNSNQLQDLIKVFPEDMLKAFNMDLANIDTAFGWLKSEGFVFIYLLIGIYSSILGSSILLKEESERTVEYMNSLPLTRTKVVVDKVVASVIYITALIAALGIFNFIAMAVSGDFDKKQLILLSITPLFPSLVLFALSLLISTFSHKTKKMLGISIGLVFASYVLNVIADMGKGVDFLRYISAFSLADSRNVIKDVKLNPVMILMTVVLFAVFFAVALFRYRKKELV